MEIPSLLVEELVAEKSLYFSTTIRRVIGVSLLSQSTSEKHNQERKPMYLCAPRDFLYLNFSQNVSTMFYNDTILLF